MIDHFRTFTQVVRLGSLSAAGRALGLSPSSVARQMDKLESHFGVQLLNRSTHLVVATEAGQKLLVEADGLLAHYDEISRGLGEVQSRPRGTLRISAMTSFGRKYISPLLPEFLERHPEVRLFVELNNRVVNLQEENIDIGIRLGAPQDSSLRARLLAPASAIVAAAPAYLVKHGVPGSPEELARHNCLVISRSRRLTYWHFRRQEERCKVAVDGNLQAASGEPLIAAARAGTGILLITGWMIREEVEEGLLTPLLTDWQASVFEEETAGVYAVFRGERFQRPALRAFIDFLVEKLPGALGEVP